VKNFTAKDAKCAKFFLFDLQYSGNKDFTKVKIQIAYSIEIKTIKDKRECNSSAKLKP